MSMIELQPTLSPTEFSRRLLCWFADHGRKHLPWQQQPTPYRVWVSEIMLQQTQVATVIPYYDRFLARFPAIRTLADAPLDEVLQLWSGLGYYARARHLHRAAGIIRDRYDGEMPLDFAALAQLPGIGRSTAGAILALAAGQRHPILDGNVKRVLARFHAIEGWPGRAEVLATLWELAERYTPTQRVAEYTQAMMDLGALLCTRSRPRCHACPLAEDCIAYRTGRQTAFPTPRPQRELPVRATRMLLLCTPAREVLLEKRPPTGVWGGLWSLPECPLDVDLDAWCRDHLNLEVVEIQPWETVRHSFSHFHLDITPVYIRVQNPRPAVMEAERIVWYNIRQPDKRGLAAPVRRLLNVLADDVCKQEQTMTRMVQCIKLGREAEGLDRPPYPGELGKRIYLHVSKEAWQQWLRQQTMLINEYRLTPIEPQARKFLEQQMEQFFFGPGSTPPEGYVPPQQ